MNTKAKGSRRERQVRDFYRLAGWVVTRAAGSHGLDLHCWHPPTGRTHVVSVKANSWPRSPEMVELASLSASIGHLAAINGDRVLVVRWDDHRGLRIRVLATAWTDEKILRLDPKIGLDIGKGTM